MVQKKRGQGLSLPTQAGYEKGARFRSTIHLWWIGLLFFLSAWDNVLPTQAVCFRFMLTKVLLC